MENTPETIPFTPVKVRFRSDGWTEPAQVKFIAALARDFSVEEAAASVGKTMQSIYRLAKRPGAESFVAAWRAARMRAAEDRATYAKSAEARFYERLVGPLGIRDQIACLPDRDLIHALQRLRARRGAIARKGELRL